MTVCWLRRLRRWAGSGLIIALNTLATGAAIGADPDPLAHRFGGPFKLTSHTGQPVSDQDFRGRFMLVYFGFTHCPDLCPTGLSVLTEALEAVGAAGDAIQPLFITVDPARDTPAALAAYQKSFHPRLVMLTGDEPQIAAVARAYKVHRRKYLWPPTAGSTGGDYGVDHGSLMYLMGRDGTFRTLIPHGTPVDKVVAILKRYIAND